MGKGIVYCGDCGKVLHEADFDKGLAHTVDNAPYCTACRAAPAEPVPPPPLTSSSTKLKASRQPRPASTARQRLPEAPAGPNRALLIGGGVAAGVLVLVIVVAVASGGGKPEEKGGGPPSESERPKSAEVNADEALIRQIEAFAASSKDPDAILLRCDEHRKRLSGTAYAARLEAIEKRALEIRQGGDWERQLNRALADAKTLAERGKEEEALRLLKSTAAMARHRKGEVDAELAAFDDKRVTRRLDEARKVAAEDPLCLRSEEVAKLLAEAKGILPSRAAEVEKRIREYEAARKASPAAGRLGPFELDDSGAILNWLLVGPFPNDEHKGYEADALGGEAAHAFASGVEVKRAGQGPLKWQAHASSDSVVDFFVDTPLKLKNLTPWMINYGACWVYAPDAVDLSLKVSSDDGYKLWVGGKAFSGKHEHRGINPTAEDMETYPLRLAKGLTRFLIKVEQGDGGHQFRLRLQKPDGSRPQGVLVFN